MYKFNSISGGQSSAYLATKFPAKYNVFSLVCIEDKKCKPSDIKLIQAINDKLESSHTIERGEFIATAEMDKTLYAVFDLEQQIGKEIAWVRGDSYEKIIRNKGGDLPNIMTRFCTSLLKIDPLFEYWIRFIGEKVDMQIGFRLGEDMRALRMQKNMVYRSPISQNIQTHRKKWGVFDWRELSFPLIDHRITKTQISNFWKGKPVRFARYNNCVGCFHRHPLFLNKLSRSEGGKMRWFADMERLTGNRWRKDTSYQKIINMNQQVEISFNEFSSCDTGYCIT